jgi:hypothetical protein
MQRRLLMAIVCAALWSPAGGAQAVLRGSVLSDPGGDPVRGAEVSVPVLQLRALTDSAGAFRIAHIPAGRQVVWVRRMGYVASSSVLNFAAGDTMDVDLLLATTPRLPEVKVTEVKPVTGKLATFERRRQAGFGRFITTEQLDKMRTHRIAEILRTIPGPIVYRDPAGGAEWVTGTRGLSSFVKTQLCFSSILIDGMVAYDGLGPKFDLRTVHTEDVAAMEFYTSTANIPVELNKTQNNTCGLLVIWMREE